jgi:sulfate transport system substrate-binding protein
LSVQARAVIDGLPADMVALALPLDVQKIADAGLLKPNWQKSFPLGSVGASKLTDMICYVTTS